ncbi:hypothetical protein P9112_004021 [Eukaryota sp. TZLM1-RC]
MSFADLKSKGNESFKSKKFEDAIHWYTEALSVSPAKEVYCNRAAAYINLGKFDEALKDADSSLSIDPSFAKAYLRKGTALCSLGRSDEARTTYNDGLKHCPGNASLEQALNELQASQTSAKAPDMASLFGNMFSPQNIAAVMSDPSVAPLLQDPNFITKLTEIQSDPNSFAKHLQDPSIQKFMTALIGKMQGNMPEPSPEQPKKEQPKKEQPKKETEPAGPVEGTSEWYYEQEKGKGVELYKKRKFDEAEEHFLKAMEYLPNDVLVRLNLASVSLEKGNLEETLSRCDDACDKAKETGKYDLIWKCYFKKGNAFARFEKFEEAIEWYEKTLTEKRDREVSLKLRDVKKKYNEWKQQQLINPEKSAEVKAEANEAFKSNDYATAIEKYSEAIKFNPDDHTLYSNRAAAYIKIMEWDLALKDCASAIQLEPNFIRAYLRRAQVNFFLKKYHKCTEDYEKILAIAPDNADAVTGLQQTQQAVMEQQRSPPDEEQMKKALEDPEISKIMSDPVIQQILQQAQTDPGSLQSHMQNPGFRDRILKLVQAGVLRMG